MIRPRVRLRPNRSQRSESDDGLSSRSRSHSLTLACLQCCYWLTVRPRRPSWLHWRASLCSTERRCSRPPLPPQRRVYTDCIPRSSLRRSSHRGARTMLRQRADELRSDRFTGSDCRDRQLQFTSQVPTAVLCCWRIHALRLLLLSRGALAVGVNSLQTDRCCPTLLSCSPLRPLLIVLLCTISLPCATECWTTPSAMMQLG